MAALLHRAVGFRTMIGARWQIRISRADVSVVQRLHVRKGASMSAESTESTIAQHRLKEFAERMAAIRASLHEVVVGQDETIDQLLICALTGSRHDFLSGFRAGHFSVAIDPHIAWHSLSCG